MTDDAIDDEVLNNITRNIFKEMLEEFKKPGVVNGLMKGLFLRYHDIKAHKNGDGDNVTIPPRICECNLLVLNFIKYGLVGRAFGTRRPRCICVKTLANLGGRMCKFFSFWVSIIALVFCTPGLVNADTLKIGGTGGDLATMRQLGDAFEKSHPETKVVVFPSLGSGGGIKAVIAGAIDIGISARPLKPQESANGIQVRAYARTALVFATHPSHDQHEDDNLEVTDLEKIFSGEQKNWDDNHGIRLVIRPEHDSDTVLVSTLSPRVAAAMQKSYSLRGVYIGSSDQEAVNLIEKIKGSLGYIGLSVILGERRNVTILRLSGFFASSDTLRSGQYPLQKTYYMVTTASPSAAAQKFESFLKSPEGVAILERTGHMVLK